MIINIHTDLPGPLGEETILSVGEYYIRPKALNDVNQHQECHVKQSSSVVRNPNTLTGTFLAAFIEHEELGHQSCQTTVCCRC